MPIIRCPSCHAAAARSTHTRDATCSSCGATLLLGGRYALVGEAPVETGLDVADGAAPLSEGEDVRTGRPVLVRIAPLGESGRLEREATVLRGLQHARVPRVLEEIREPSVGRALVLSHPGAPSLEHALQQGLRVDAQVARGFLVELLEIVAYLHSLSPPVIHRHLHPRSVRWDGRGPVSLLDFTRATDVRADAVADPVLAREGYAPPTRVEPVALDLYGAAATTVHLLTRTPPARLEHDDEGRPRFREAANVDEGLARVLDRLLSPGSRDSFSSAREAIDALLERPAVPVGGEEARRGIVIAIAAAAVLVVGMVTVGAATFLSASSDVPPVMAPSGPPVPPPTSEAPPPAPPSEPKPPTQPTKARAPATSGSDVHERLLRALRKSVSEARAELEACVRPEDDRLRFTVEVGPDGRVKSARVKDRRAAQSSSSCAAAVLVGLRAEKPRARPVQAEVTIYFRPSFRVTAF